MIEAMLKKLKCYITFFNKNRKNNTTTSESFKPMSESQRFLNNNDNNNLKKKSCIYFRPQLFLTLGSCPKHSLKHLAPFFHGKTKKNHHLFARLNDTGRPTIRGQPIGGK
jgi:hypothetical protein